MADSAQSFKDWFIDRGGFISPKISLFGDTGIPGDRGVRAISDIEQGEQLLLVPVQSTLHVPKPSAPKNSDSPEESCQAAALQYITNTNSNLSTFLQTALLLLAEMALGEASKYWPYLENLPERSDCLLYWGDEDKALLAGSSIEDKGKGAEAVFNDQVQPVLAGAPQLFPAPFNDYQHFRRAVDLTQTRAFHMVKENWVTGASEEATEDLYLIPGIDMLNHATDPGARNTQLFRFSSGAEVALEGGKTLGTKGIFAMKAERAIAAGEQVLHTYGDLSDGQLLQTYGFVEEFPAGKDNPHNYCLLPFEMLLEACRATAEGASELRDELVERKVALLAGCNLLQPAAPRATEFVVTRISPASDELLTTAQVLLLMEEEFDQLEAETKANKEGSSARPSSSSGGKRTGKKEKGSKVQEAGPSSGGGSSSKAMSLSLGRDLLLGDFGEMVASALLQAVGLCLKRYPTNVKEDGRALKGCEPGTRVWAATKVALGEKDLLHLLKRQALQIMVLAAAADEAEMEDEDEDDEFEEEEDEDEEEEEEEGEEEEERAVAARQQRSRHGLGFDAAAAAAAGQRGSKKQKRDEEQEEEEEEGAEPCEKGGKSSGRDGSEKGRHHHKHHHHHKHKRSKKDDRPHYGQMTGPKEEDVLQSDDSDKVGYSSESENESEQAAAGGGRKARGTAKKTRHPTGDPEEHHRYEVAAEGRVREVHGHMLGPEEAELLDSEDSDKVGYA